MKLAIGNVESYAPGTSIAQLKSERRDLAGRRIIKLASNENPLGPSPKAVAAIRRGAREIHRYPEATSPSLREALASHSGSSADEILVTSGIDEALRLIAETLLGPDDCCVLSQYAFSRYRQHAQLMGANVIEVPVQDFHVDLKQMAQEALDRRAKVLFIANPNNPTSTFNTDQELRVLFERLGPDGPAVVLDEAYGEFARDLYPELYPRSMLFYFKLYPRLIVLRTLSKIMGLAGMRIGYCAADKELIARMNKIKLVFNVTI
ncbi:MAG: aminotransferase class I/II-fold pyridoxal phosphate-dependent enzyme, partial [Elusimicrobia bacterium]|nr:aminotransferase class I/II-fold pyridoxal phosphate-dependent enzyme [Elusimicrobiota bacterium]